MNNKFVPQKPKNIIKVDKMFLLFILSFAIAILFLIGHQLMIGLTLLILSFIFFLKRDKQKINGFLGEESNDDTPTQGNVFWGNKED